MLDFIAAGFDTKLTVNSIKIMAETKQEREKRLAAALRENLKRRKVQTRAVPDSDRATADARKFREKPIQSPKQGK